MVLGKISAACNTFFLLNKHSELSMFTLLRINENKSNFSNYPCILKKSTTRKSIKQKTNLLFGLNSIASKSNNGNQS